MTCTSRAGIDPLIQHAEKLLKQGFPKGAVTGIDNRAITHAGHSLVPKKSEWSDFRRVVLQPDLPLQVGGATTTQAIPAAWRARQRP